METCLPAGRPYNTTTVCEERAKTMEKKKLTIHPPKRIMPTSSGISVLGGNQINNS
jgi:hypothetical protein